jgi:APA family basic amino acid/polyamine antiporter
VLVLASSVSAMTLTGPRVYQAMAKDGLLPKQLIAKPGAPPRVALAAQGCIVLLLVFTQSFESLMHNVGAILTASTMLTAIAVVAVHKRSPVPPLALVAAGVYAVSCAGILFFSLWGSWSTIAWFIGTSAIVAVAYFMVPKRA